MNIVTIEGAALPVLEINHQRVLTLAMVDDVHGRPTGTARKRFNDHKSRFIKEEDYFVRNTDEAQKMGFVAPNGLILLTESGYLMLVKSFTDELAWKVQRSLIQHYFRVKQSVPETSAVLSDPASLRALLLDYAEKALALEAEVQELTPKAAFHDAVTEAINCQTVQEVAKVLGVGPNKLFQFLRDERMLMHNNLPYQHHIDAGHFRVVEKCFRDEHGERNTYTRTLVTGKGLAYIQRRLQSPLPMLAAA